MIFDDWWYVNQANMIDDGRSVPDQLMKRRFVQCWNAAIENAAQIASESKAGSVYYAPAEIRRLKVEIS